MGDAKLEVGSKLELFNLVFDTPTKTFEGRVTNLGGSIAERAGVWTFNAVDAQGHAVSAKDMGISWSSHLQLPFAYVSETPAGGLMKLPTIALRRPIVSLDIGYAPIFTTAPIKTDQFGPLIFSVDPAQQEPLTASSIALAWRNEYAA